MMKYINLARWFLCLQLCITSIASATTLDSLTSRQAAGKYSSYPYMYEAPPAMTPAPEGYEPFHIEHYGRHGSRWHIGYKYYDQSYDILKKASDAGELTDLGERTFQEIKKIRENAHKGRSGELTEIGAIQHRIIATRMVENFPQIFTSDARLTARSSVIIRAILSMQNGLDAIRTLCPDIKMSFDASNADMWYLKYEDEKAEDIRHKLSTTVLKEYKSHHANCGKYLKNIIRDNDYAIDSIGGKLFTPLFYALANSQSHPDQPWLLDSIFSQEEIGEQWLHGNADWFIQCGNSKLTENRMPYTQSNLLLNIINSVDTVLLSPTPSINLRYGHDSVVLPLAALMEIDNWGEEINDLEELIKYDWKDYLIVPMAANIQMIFYRNPQNLDKEDILVKVLLNEQEVNLPVGKVTGPYYKWSKLKDYYMSKISSFKESN